MASLAEISKLLDEKLDNLLLHERRPWMTYKVPSSTRLRQTSRSMPQLTRFPIADLKEQAAANQHY
jgi:hypothetical protein